MGSSDWAELRSGKDHGGLMEHVHYSVFIYSSSLIDDFCNWTIESITKKMKLSN